MARIDDMKAELQAVRQQIASATEAVSLSTSGRSLTRQSLSELRKREAELSWAIDEHYRGGPLKRAEVEDDYHL